MAILAVYRGDQLVRSFELGEAPTRIGRAPENELVLEDKDKGVSRAHAEIRYDRGRYVIADLNSQNGVWIGERRVRMDTLPPDVPVTIGPYRLVLVPEPQPAVPGKGAASGVHPAPPEEPAVEPTEYAQPEPAVSRSGRTNVAAPPPQARQSNRKMVAALAVIGVVAAALIVVAVVGRDPEPDGTTTTTTPIAETNPDAEREQQFQTHLDNAVGHLQRGDTTAALAENDAALAILPSDPRALKQREEIDAIVAGGDNANATPLEDPPLVAEGEKPPVTPTTAPAGSTLAPSLRLTRKAGESAAQRDARERNAKSLLDEGKDALENRRYSEAIEKLQQALEVSERNDYGNKPGEAAELLQAAKTAKSNADAAARRAQVVKLVDDGKELVATDIVAASRKLREARNLDPQAPGLAELQNAVEQQARVEGGRALGSAKDLENRRRTEDAEKAYERAVQLLELIPGGHKDLDFARKRLAELRR